MRWVAVGCAVGLVFVLLGSPASAALVICDRRDSPPGIAQLAGRRWGPRVNLGMVKPDLNAEGIHTFLAWGVIDEEVPSDAHGERSFFLNVRRYFRGAGPSRIEVTRYAFDHGAFDPHAPGEALEYSREFVRRYGGKQAVVFGSTEPTKSRFTGQYTTGETCPGFTVYGDEEAAEYLKLLHRIFDGAHSPLFWTLVSAGATSLLAAVVMLLLRRRRVTPVAVSPPSGD